MDILVSDLSANAVADLPAELIATPILSRRLDGESLTEVLITISVTTYPFFRTWLNAGSRKRKTMSVRIGGISFNGYDEEEIQRLLTHIEAELADRASESGADLE